MAEQDRRRIIVETPLPPEVEAILRRIPLFEDERTIHAEPLREVISLNNANYRISAGGREYFLRVAAETGRWLGVRRNEEIEAAKAAAAAGVAPEILYEEPAGHLLMPFLPGRHWKQEEFRQPENLRRVIEMLHRLQQVRHLQGDGSAYRRIERLLESASALQLELPPNIADCRKRLSDIERLRAEDPRFTPCLSHNDLWANNFLDDGANLWLFDWEFGGHGDGLYDVATTALAGALSTEEETSLLRAFGYDRPGDDKILVAMKFVACFFEASWALVQHGLRGSGDFDYLTYSQTMFARM